MILACIGNPSSLNFESSTSMTATLLISLVSVLFYLVADTKKHFKGRVLGKMLASTMFLALAILSGASQSLFGQIMMAAFLFSWLGDLFLLSREQKWFLAGLVSFLLAHIAFTVAFYQRGVATEGLLFPSMVIIFTSLLVSYWLVPKVNTEMKIPVIAYIAAIIVMVISAFGTHLHQADSAIPLAACIFMASDLLVARDQFVKEGLINRRIGAPLYFVAQMIFALTVG
jgi:uncharacterized membrane protein YhhN